VIIDLFSRCVVGWSMSASMTAQLVTDALIMVTCH
jgi:putative transposase